MQKLTMLKMLIQSKISRFLKEEKGEVNIVAIVILIGIAVVLAIIFKDAIKGLIEDLLNTIQKGASNAVSGP